MDASVPAAVPVRVQTPAHTMMNASSVPMLGISPRAAIGTVDAKPATTNPTIKDDIHGVRNLGWTLLKTLDRSPSFDIEKNTRVVPQNLRRPGKRLGLV